MPTAEPLPFLKMHGLGNDFVIIDTRKSAFVPTERFLRALADRRRGIGCDQVIILKKPNSPKADIHMGIYNLDGSQARACGNATRCVGSLMFEELGRKECVVETIAGLLPVWREDERLISVDFGKPLLKWDEIPLSHVFDTLHVSLSSQELGEACCVNMGNPHAVFFVKDVEKIDLAAVGPGLESDPLFPQRCNIEIAQILAPDRIRMRVWERGSGITEACGSGACATAVAAVRRGLTERRMTVVLDGGELMIEWRDDDHVIMTGIASLSYQGVLAERFEDDQCRT